MNSVLVSLVCILRLTILWGGGRRGAADGAFAGLRSHITRLRDSLASWANLAKVHLCLIRKRLPLTVTVHRLVFYNTVKQGLGWGMGREWKRRGQDSVTGGQAALAHWSQGQVCGARQKRVLALVT